MPSEEKPNPFRGPTFTLSAGFLAVVALLPIGIFLRDTGPGTGGSETTRVHQQPAGNSDGANPACRPTDTSQAVPRKAPAGVVWNIYKTVAMPYSRAAGPFVLDGEIVRCYAPTPTGALVAAAQISTRSALSEQWRAVTELQAVPGPARDAFIEAPERHTKESVEPVNFGQIAGFKFVSYSRQAAVVELVKRFFSGRMSVSTQTVKWYGGDWRLEIPSAEKGDARGRAVSSLDGYVVWRGV